VKILFDPEQTRWIRERKWHESQELEYQPDGSLILSLKVSGLGEDKTMGIKLWRARESTVPCFSTETLLVYPVLDNNNIIDLNKEREIKKRKAWADFAESCRENYRKRTGAGA